jgi:mono/diheme cytochrome c family protein
MQPSPAFALLLALACASPARADDAAARGRRVAQDKCASCHLVDNAARGRALTSPNPSAPPFQVIAMTYLPSDLEEALAEGIVVAHNQTRDPQMPEFALAPRDVQAVVAYLETLRRR